MDRKPREEVLARPETRGAIAFTPIGIVRSPFVEKVSAPRQATTAAEVEGTIELFPGRDLEHALEDIETWDRLWVIFAFHRAEGWRPKVLPPRSAKRRGVLATRSPHRPNPIGLSAVRLIGVQGLTLRIRDLDILDGTPVLDLKPYVPYADAFPDASSGWLDAPRDPIAPTLVRWTDAARTQAAWLARHGVDLVSPAEASLALGPEPNAYRRIRRIGEGSEGAHELAIKDWRVRFQTEAIGEASGLRKEIRTRMGIVVTGVHSGYRARELATGDGPALELARAFLVAFGARRPPAGDGDGDG